MAVLGLPCVEHLSTVHEALSMHDPQPWNFLAFNKFYYKNLQIKSYALKLTRSKVCTPQ